jgi:nucleoside-diphosphate-sugar epimerase
MRIHVTGAAGFLARSILPLLRANHEVDATDRSTLDVTDAAAVLQHFHRTKPELVVHLAALCGAKPSRERPPEFFATNALGAVNVLEACRRAGVPRLLFTSSMTVFGAGDEARAETSPFAPRHPYAVSKVAAEFACLNYCRDFGLAISVLRPTLVIGEGYKEPHAVGDFTETVLRGDDIVLFGDGSHRRDFVHPEDVAGAVVAAVGRLGQASAGSYETFNISNGQVHRMVELADLVIRVVGRGRVVHRPATDQTFSLFTRIDRARELLGYRPQIDTEEIVRRLVKNSALAASR